jgi:hypothetical protein
MRKAPPTRMVRLREIATGQVRDAWPVDARDMLHTGGWEAVGPDTPTAPSVPAVPATLPTHNPAEWLEAKSYKELQVLAKRAGLTAGQKKDELIAALMPLVASGVVSLEELPAMQPDPVQFPNVVTAE